MLCLFLPLCILGLRKLKMESKKLITKENFKFLGVPNLLVNVFGYGEIVSLKLNKKWCLELLKEKWNNEEWLPLDLVLKNLKIQRFFYVWQGVQRRAGQCI